MVLLQDAPGIMAKLSMITKKTYGDDVWQEIFGNITMPKVGWTLDEMSNFTRDIERKYCSATSIEKYECACETVAHCWIPDWDKDGRAKFLEMRSIDALCVTYNNGLIEILQKSHGDGSLFFTQEVDNEVVEYVRVNPQIYRIDDKIYVKRMPYLTKRYLNEPDIKMKRYYACHCPWIRNSILQAEGPVSRSFCHCSLGLVKKGFEIAFDRNLIGRVISSVMDEGVLLCIFEIDIPNDILEQYT